MTIKQLWNQSGDGNGADDARDARESADQCTCQHYVVDYSDPERYHPENVDREDDPACPIHGSEQHV